MSDLHRIVGQTPLNGFMPGIMSTLMIAGKIGAAAQVAKDRKVHDLQLVWHEKAPVDRINLIPTVPAEVWLQHGDEAAALDKMIAAGMVQTAPLNTIVRLQVGDITPGGRLVGDPIRLQKLEIDTHALNPAYAGFILICTKELLKAGGSKFETLLGKVGRVAMAAATDRQAFGGAIDSSTPVGSASGFPAAVQEAIQSLSVTGSSRVGLLMSPDAAKIGASLQGASGALYPNLSPSGGMVGGIPAYRTAALDGVRVAAVDADAIIANSGKIEVDVSDDADVNMVDDPETGATTLVSLFQTNSSGLRVLREFGMAFTREDAISIVEITPGP